MDEKFDDEHITTLGLDFATKKYTTKDGKEINIKIWDTAGQERFKALTYAFYKKADGIIIAYDITEEKTFDSIDDWIESINEYADDGVPKIMVGTKCELADKRTVSYDEAKQLADHHELNYYEVSAKMNIGIEDCMVDIIE